MRIHALFLRHWSLSNFLNTGDTCSSFLGNLLVSYEDSEDAEFDIIKNQDFKSIYFIDFGLSYVSSQNEDKAVDLYVLRRAIISSNPKSEEIVRIYYLN